MPSANIRHLIVTGAMVDDPAGELAHILAHPDDPEREAAFLRILAEEEDCLKKHVCRMVPEWRKSYGIAFSDRRIALIVKHAMERQTDVENMAEEFQAIENAARDYVGKFSERNGLDVSFSDEAIDALAEKVWNEPQELDGCLRLLLQNYDHGLKLIKEKTGKEHFQIPAEGVENPEVYLNRLIQEAYR